MVKPTPYGEFTEGKLTMTTATFSRRSGHLNAASTVRFFMRRVIGLANHFLASLEVARQRRQLLRLDDRALNDIGIGRADAHREATRGFWNIPEDMKTRN